MRHFSFVALYYYARVLRESEAIHWATGGWSDWDVQTTLVRSNDVHKSIAQQFKEERDALTHAGLIASIEMLGVQDATLSTSQARALRQSLGRVLRWPASKIVDVQASDNTMCDRITLTRTSIAADGTTLPEGFGDNRFGDYLRVPSVSTRPVYRQAGDDGWYMYFGAETAHMGDTGGSYTNTKRWWVVGPTLGGAQAGLIATDNVSRPDQVRQGGWYSFEQEGGWQQQAGISATCNPIKRTTIKFRAATTLCNKAEITVLKRLPHRLAAGIFTLRNDLAFAGVDVKRISIKQMRVSSCNPRIFLALASAEKARVMAAEADAECHRRMSNSVMKHWGCNLHQVFHDLGSHITKNVFGLANKQATAPPTPAPTPVLPTKAPSAAAATTASPTTGPWHLRARHVAATPGQLDCAVGAWRAASHCSVTCGVGIVQFHRVVLSEASDTGAPCPALTETRECRLPECPELSPVAVKESDASPSQITALLDGAPDTGVALTPMAVSATGI